MTGGRAIVNTIELAGVQQYVRDSERVNDATRKISKAIVEQSEAAKESSFPDAAGYQKSSNKVVAAFQKSATSIQAIFKNIFSGIITAFKKAVLDIPNILRETITSGILGTLNGLRTIIVAPFKVLAQIAGFAFRAVLAGILSRAITDILFNQGKGIAKLIGRDFSNEFSQISKLIPNFLTRGFENFRKTRLGQLASSYGTRFVEQFGKAFQTQLGSVLFEGLGGDASRYGKIGQQVAEKALSGVKVSGFSKISKDAGEAADNVKKKFDSVGDTAKSVTNRISGSFSSMSGFVKKAGLAVAALGIAFIGLTVVLPILNRITSALIRLGEEGARVQGIARGFDATTARLGVGANDFLNRLRQGAGGEVSDVALIRQSNIATAGLQQGLVGDALIEGLPKLLEIARAQARATGQDVTFLFESLVTGIKRSSPLLIDNTGLVLSLGKAQEQYAQSVGKTVEQLSDEEKQVALLQATIAAGAPAVAQLNKNQNDAIAIAARRAAAEQNLATRIQLAFVPITNAYNNFRLGLTKAFTAVFDAIKPLWDAIVNFSGALIRAYYAINPVIIAMKLLFVVVKAVFSYIWQDVQVVYAILVEAFNGAAYVINSVVDAVQGFLNKIVGGIRDALGGTIGEVGKVPGILQGFKDGFFGGAARLFGALAGGFIYAYNRWIAPVIIGIATFIADFLTGSSPAKRGPLSKIDVGAAKLMQAWVGGIAGINLDPVGRVGKQVMQLLGDSASLGAEQIKARLATLDKALQPFIDRVDLLKARFEAIAEPLNKAKDIIEGRLNKAVEDLLAGTGNAEAVRALDAQMEAINARVSAGQEELELAELQLAIMRAMQGEERTALGIRQRMLGVTEQITSATGAGGVGAGSAAGGGSGSATGGLGGGGGVAGPLGPEDGSSLKSLGGGFDTSGIFDMLGNNFNAGVLDVIGPDGLANFDANNAALSEQFGRIGEGIGDLPDRIIDGFKNLPTKFGEIWQEIQDTASLYWDSAKGTISSLLTGAGDAISAGWIYLTGDGEGTLRGDLTAAWTGLSGDLTTLFGEDSVFRSTITGFKDAIVGDINSLVSTFTTFFGDGAEEKGLIKTIIDGAVATLEGVFGETFGPFGAVFRNVGETLRYWLASPLETVLNGMIGLFEGAINFLIDAVKLITEDNIFAQGLSKLGVNTSTGLERIEIPRVNLSQLLVAAPEGREGGLFGPGIMKVHADEYIMPAQKIGIIPQTVSRAIDAAINAPAPSYAAMGRAVTWNIGDIHNHHPLDTGESIVRAQHRALMGRL